MHTALYFVANRLLADEELAKDLVADVFLKVWETKALLTHVQNIKAFLYTATRNRSLDHLKKARHTIPMSDLPPRPEQGEYPYEDFLQAVYNAETIRVLYLAIEGLPPECRKVMELGLEGFSTGEIAERLGISPSAVSNQKTRAVRLLKEKLPLTVIWLLFTLPIGRH